MTANSEAFDPGKPTAAHKHLPLPIHVKVIILANNRSIILRVNDRGSFYGNHHNLYQKHCHLTHL